MNLPFTRALGSDISVPGYSEVLWVEPNKPNGTGIAVAIQEFRINDKICNNFQVAGNNLPLSNLVSSINQKNP